MENEPLKEAQRRYEASEQGKLRNKQYKERNKEKFKAYRKEWYANKMATDPAFAEKERERIRECQKRRQAKKQESAGCWGWSDGKLKP